MSIQSAINSQNNVCVDEVRYLDSEGVAWCLALPPRHSHARGFSNRVPRAFAETTSAVVARREPIAPIAPTE